MDLLKNSTIFLALNMALFVAGIFLGKKSKMPHLAIGFFLRRNKYKIAKVRYFPGEKLYIKAFSSFSLIFI